MTPIAPRRGGFPKIKEGIHQPVWRLSFNDDLLSEYGDLQNQPGITLHDRFQNLVSFVGYDRVPSFVPLQNHVRILQFPQVEKQVSATKPGHFRKLGEALGLRSHGLHNHEPVLIRNRLQDRFDHDICRKLRNRERVHPFTNIYAQGTHKVYLFFEKPGDFRSTLAAVLIRKIFLNIFQVIPERIYHRISN